VACEQADHLTVEMPKVVAMMMAVSNFVRFAFDDLVVLEVVAEAPAALVSAVHHIPLLAFRLSSSYAAQLQCIRRRLQTRSTTMPRNSASSSAVVVSTDDGLCVSSLPSHHSAQTSMDPPHCPK
jgi:hypothetical protein